MSEEYFRGYSDAHDDLMVQIKEDMEITKKKLDDIFDNYGKDENMSKDNQYIQMNQLIGRRSTWELVLLYLLINNDGKKGCSINAHLREGMT